MKKLTALFATLLISFTVHAREVAGVTLENTLTLDQQTLQLNGVGIRKMLFMDLYVGSLYTNTKTSDANDVINNKKPVAIQLDIVSGMITSERMASTVNEGFDTATNGNVAPMRERLDNFIAVFDEAIVKGDRFTMLAVPDKGLKAYKNGNYLTTVEGTDFSKTLLSIWLGETPADKNLKKAMLEG